VEWGILFAILAALSTAGATVMQAIGARHARHFPGVNPRLFLAVFRSGAYIVGIVLLTASFILTLIALHSTPLFVVQAISAASLALIAGASVVLYHTRLAPVEWIAVGAVFAGVVLLVVAQHPSAATRLPAIGQWSLLIAAVALAAVSIGSHRFFEGAAMPALLAGLAFGDAAVASRVIADVNQSLAALVLSPVSWAIVISGLLGALSYATALQRGSITAVFGLSTVGQTLAPAAVGWLLLGDRVHPGLLPVAAVGFGLAVVGAVSLGRHAHPESVLEEQERIDATMRHRKAPRPAPADAPPPAGGGMALTPVDTARARAATATPALPVTTATPGQPVPAATPCQPVPATALAPPVAVSELALPGTRLATVIDRVIVTGRKWATTTAAWVVRVIMGRRASADIEH
jgi:drug/metabolite transporter (DMT)-like permease